MATLSPRSLVRFAKTWFREPAGDDFDLESEREVNAALVAHGVEPLTLDLADAEERPARFILANLVCNRAVRRHYPSALQCYSQSAFGDYLRGGLSPQAAARVSECLDNPPSEPVKRVLEVREDLRELYPFALTPRQRRQFLAWLLVHGTRELGISAEAALWYLIELDETSDRGLIPTYLLNARWQARVPLALTAFGWAEFIEFLQNKYSITSRWLRDAAWRPTLRPADELKLLRQTWHQLFRDFPADHERVPGWLNRTFAYRRLPRRWIRGLAKDHDSGLATAPGVNLIGHYRYASGLQEACAGVASALETQGVRLAKRDLPVHFPSDWRDRERYQSLEVFDTTIYVAAANTFPKEYFRRSGLHMRPSVRRIAVWYWEVDRLPAEWTQELTWAHEVWAPTRFLAEAFKKSVSVPVLPMLPGVKLPEFERKPRKYFELPEDKKLVLFSFDMGSVMERKNPLGLIEAYRKAFRPDDRTHLCIKVSRGEFHPHNLAMLKEACRSVNATLIDTVLPRKDVLALFATADCYASLHRAEGLGLGMAESMLMGKPVVATAYSGNLDFMNEGNSFLVKARTVEIDDVPPYPRGSVWAEPELEHAANQLRAALRDDAREVAEQGIREVSELLSIEAAGARMAARLAETRR